MNEKLATDWKLPKNDAFNFLKDELSVGFFVLKNFSTPPYVAGGVQNLIKLFCLGAVEEKKKSDLRVSVNGNEKRKDWTLQSLDQR